jgi:hypothetical protein
MLEDFEDANGANHSEFNRGAFGPQCRNLKGKGGTATPPRSNKNNAIWTQAERSDRCWSTTVPNASSFQALLGRRNVDNPR